MVLLNDLSSPPSHYLNNPTYVIVISDADGRRTSRSKHSELRSARQDEERQKLEYELQL